jgi:hypothetical protein
MGEDAWQRWCARESTPEEEFGAITYQGTCGEEVAKQLERDFPRNEEPPPPQANAYADRLQPSC